MLVSLSLFSSIVPSLGFVAGQIKEEKGDTVVCQRLDTMETVSLPAENVQKANPPKYNKVRISHFDDCCPDPVESLVC